MKFQKNPVVVDALRWTGRNQRAVLEFCTDPDGTPAARFSDSGTGLTLDTPEGALTVSLGNWIIKDVKGEYSQCRSDIFSLLYTPLPLREAVRRQCPREGHCTDGWICEQHPWLPWPHADCAGPGMSCGVLRTLLDRGAGS